MYAVHALYEYILTIPFIVVVKKYGIWADEKSLRQIRMWRHEYIWHMTYDIWLTANSFTFSLRWSDVRISLYPILIVVSDRIEGIQICKCHECVRYIYPTIRFFASLRTQTR